MIQGGMRKQQSQGTASFLIDGAKKMVAGAAYIAMIDIMIFPEQKHGKAFFFQHILIERIVDCERLFFFFAILTLI